MNYGTFENNNIGNLNDSSLLESSQSSTDVSLNSLKSSSKINMEFVGKIVDVGTMIINIISIVLASISIADQES